MQSGIKNARHYENYALTSYFFGRNSVHGSKCFISDVFLDLVFIFNSHTLSRQLFNCIQLEFKRLNNLHDLDFVQGNFIKCSSCHDAISDRFIFKILNQCFHSKCLRCKDCQSNLTESCFTKDGDVYCRNDFFR
jgi:hypothetical protein